jgi:hypothetical protein
MKSENKRSKSLLWRSISFLSRKKEEASSGSDGAGPPEIDEKEDVMNTTLTGLGSQTLQIGSL